MYAEFDLEMPDRLGDALAILAEGGACLPIAGGTNLIVDMRAKPPRPARLVALERIAELRGIEAADGRIAIGGGATVSDLLESPAIAAGAPALLEAARVFGGQMVRNAATVAGNVAYGSPAADLVPPLMALDARVTLTSREGAREVALDDYFLDYKKDVRRNGELITRVSWARPPEGTAQVFYKLGRRKGDAITVTGVAVTLEAANGRCARARIALGALAPVVFRARRAEALLEGRALDDARIEDAARCAAEDCRPIADVRASAEYRRHTARVLVRRLLAQAWARIA